MTAAFQPNGFQNNAFQVDGAAGGCFVQTNAFQQNAFQPCPPGGCAFQQGQVGAQPIAFQLNAFQPCEVPPPTVVRVPGGRRVILDPDFEDSEGGFVPYWLLTEH